MSEPAKSSKSAIERESQRPVPGVTAHAAGRAMDVRVASAPVPEPLPLREMEQIERELGVRRHRIASSPGVLAGPPLVPDAATLERLMSVWRFEQPPSAWTTAEV